MVLAKQLPRGFTRVLRNADRLNPSGKLCARRLISDAAVMLAARNQRKRGVSLFRGAGQSLSGA